MYESRLIRPQFMHLSQTDYLTCFPSSQMQHEATNQHDAQTIPIITCNPLPLTSASSESCECSPVPKSLRRAVESHLEARLTALQREIRLEAGGTWSAPWFFGDKGSQKRDSSTSCPRLSVICHWSIFDGFDILICLTCSFPYSAVARKRSQPS